VPILWFVSGVNLELYGVIICVECVPTLAGKKLLDLIPIIKNQPLNKKKNQTYDWVLNSICM